MRQVRRGSQPQRVVVARARARHAAAGGTSRDRRRCPVHASVACQLRCCAKLTLPQASALTGWRQTSRLALRLCVHRCHSGSRGWRLVRPPLLRWDARRHWADQRSSARRTLERASHGLAPNVTTTTRRRQPRSRNARVFSKTAGLCSAAVGNSVAVGVRDLSVGRCDPLARGQPAPAGPAGREEPAWRRNATPRQSLRR